MSARAFDASTSLTGRAPWRGGRRRGPGFPRGDVLAIDGVVVRFVDARELDALATLQADAFFEPVGFVALDRVLRDAFAADVRRTLMRKYAYASAGRFAPLCVERGDGTLAGGCELSVQRDAGTVRSALEAIGDEWDESKVGNGEYAYLSCAAVERRSRGRGVGTALVRGAETLASEWGFDFVALHVFETNVAALRAYEKCGYDVVERCARTPWDVVKNQTKLLMVRRV